MGDKGLPEWMRSRMPVMPQDAPWRGRIIERAVSWLVTLACAVVLMWCTNLLATDHMSHGSARLEKSGRFGTGRITVDVGTLPNPDCWFEVGMIDSDGKPGGRKIINVEPICE